MSETPEDTDEPQATSPTTPPVVGWKEDVAIMLAQAERRANRAPVKQPGDGW